MERYNKAVAAFLVGLVGVLRDVFGVEILGLGDEALNGIAAAITVVLVYVIRNRMPPELPPEPPTPPTPPEPT